MKKIKIVLVLLGLVFSFSFLVACSEENSFFNVSAFSELDENETVVDEELPAEETEEELPTEETEENLGYEELLEVVKAKYRALMEAAVQSFQDQVKAKEIEILGETYALKLAELEALQAEYQTLYTNFYQTNDLTLIKEQLITLSNELLTLERGSEEYLAKVEELKALWTTVSAKFDLVSQQARNLSSQMATLKTELRAMYMAKQVELQTALKTLRQDFGLEVKAIQEAFIMEVKMLQETFGIEIPVYQRPNGDGSKCEQSNYYGPRR